MDLLPLGKGSDVLKARPTLSFETGQRGNAGRRPLGPFFTRRDDEITTPRIAEVLQSSLETTPPRGGQFSAVVDFGDIGRLAGHERMYRPYVGRNQNRRPTETEEGQLAPVAQRIERRFPNAHKCVRSRRQETATEGLTRDFSLSCRPVQCPAVANRRKFWDGFWDGSERVVFVCPLPHRLWRLGVNAIVSRRG